MPTTIKPANPQQTAARRKELFLAFITKIFDAMKKNGKNPVILRSLLGSRSEIFLGLRLSDESVEEAQDRIINQFCDNYPLLADSDAISVE